MIIFRRSPVSGKINSFDLDISQEQILKYEKGFLIQDAFPHLTDDEREFIKSGILPEEWEKLFGQLEDKPQERMKIINLTPHAITEVITGKVFSPSGVIARVSQQTKQIKEIDGVPFFTCEFGETVDLPEQVENTLYIVSAMVKNANNRPDLISPGELVRDNKGQPIGCKGFFIG